MQTQTNVGELTRSFWFPSEGRIEEILFADAPSIRREKQTAEPISAFYASSFSAKSPRQGHFTDDYEP